MCGIVGIVAKSNNGLFKHHTDTFKQMLFVDQLRGFDGTGVFYSIAGEVQVLKRATHATPLIMSEEFDKAMVSVTKDSPFVVGHNRATTRGESVWKNTHPFTENHITLVHNGTLNEHKSLNNTVDVDSHAICKHMAQETEEDTLKNINGAFALVWYNEDTYTLNLCRNDDRPLFIIECSSCYIICSEVGLGKWIAARNNIMIVKEIPLVSGTKYTFNLHELGTLEETVMTLRPKPNWTRYNNYNYHNNKEENKKKNKFIGKIVQFTPYKIGEKKTAILFDIVTNKYFLLGRVEEKPHLIIRVFGDIPYLKILEAAKELEGQILSVERHSKSLTCKVGNVCEIIEGEVLENTDTSMYSKEDCAFCSSPIMKNELLECKDYLGGKLCPECVKQFKEWNWEIK